MLANAMLAAIARSAAANRRVRAVGTGSCLNSSIRDERGDRLQADNVNTGELDEYLALHPSWIPQEPRLRCGRRAAAGRGYWFHLFDLHPHQRLAVAQPSHPAP